jgi:hypothetical protein
VRLACLPSRCVPAHLARFIRYCSNSSHVILVSKCVRCSEYSSRFCSLKKTAVVAKIIPYGRIVAARNPATCPYRVCSSLPFAELIAGVLYFHMDGKNAGGQHFQSKSVSLPRQPGHRHFSVKCDRHHVLAAELRRAFISR